MTEDGRLENIILTADRSRAIRVIDTLMKMEPLNEQIKLYKTNSELYINNVIYKWVHPSRSDGCRADQVIVDYVGDNPQIARYMLFSSCVPDNYQIIDDRKLI